MYESIVEGITHIVQGFANGSPTSDIDIGIDHSGLHPPTIIDKILQIGLQGPRVDGKKYMAQLFGGIHDVSLVADMAAALFNSPMHTVKASGIHLHVEKEVIHHLSGMISFRDGILCPGGSISNLTAMVIARYAHNFSSKEYGIMERYRVYASDEAHYCVKKNAGITGIGRVNVISIPSLDGKMDQKILRESIQADLAAKFCPLLIVSTSGTTKLGQFEDLVAITTIAKEFNLWHHVDAAFGGGLLFSSKHKYKLSGIEDCDSITWDHHKLFSAPLPSSVLLTKRDDVLLMLAEEAEYLFAESHPNDAGHKTIQCARRNDALKLWAMLNQGQNYLENLIDKKMEIASYAADRIMETPGLTLLTNPQLPLVCLRSTRCDVYERLKNDGIICSQVTINDLKWVRVSLVDSALTQQDVERIISLLL